MAAFGVVARQPPGMRDLQRDVNAKLRVFGAGQIGEDGRRGPETGTALTYLLGPGWYAIRTVAELRQRVQRASSPFMADRPGGADVRVVQGVVGVGQDGELGPATWTAISERFGSDFEWWRHPFANVVRVLTRTGREKPQEPQEPAPQRPQRPVVPAMVRQPTAPAPAEPSPPVLPVVRMPGGNGRVKIDEPPVKPKPPKPKPPPSTPPRRRTGAIIAAVVAGVGAVALLGVAVAKAARA